MSADMLLTLNAGSSTAKIALFEAAPSGARSIRHFKNVLIVFPHANDETVTCGGTIRRLANEGATITLVLLTGGELGNPTGTLDLSLKATRRGEVECAASILGVIRVIQEYFRDGRLSGQLTEIKSALSRTMTYLDPDLIVTCDAAGLDGHPDHVACSEAVTEMRRLILPRAALWYVASPAGPLTLAPHLAKLAPDPGVDARRLSIAHAAYGAAAGSHTVTVVPSRSRLSRRNWPRWSCTICLTIARPRPVPPNSRERARSTR